MNKFTGLLAGALLSMVVLAGFTVIPPTASYPAGDELDIPENINAIFKNSCYGCHNSESKNEKAKKKMKIDKLAGLNKSKLVAKLNKIVKEIEEGEMPPEKFAAKYPERVPSKEDQQALINWAKGEVDKLTQ